jgi:hypothetical protein
VRLHRMLGRSAVPAASRCDPAIYMATAAEKDDVALTVGNHDRVPAAVGFHRRSNVMILGCLFLLVGATIPCAVLGTIMAIERSCELKV